MDFVREWIERASNANLNLNVGRRVSRAQSYVESNPSLDPDDSDESEGSLESESDSGSVSSDTYFVCENLIIQNLFFLGQLFYALRADPPEQLPKEALHKILATLLFEGDVECLDRNRKSRTLRAMLGPGDKMLRKTNVPQRIFYSLLRRLEVCHELTNVGLLSAAQKLHIFLRICGGGASVEQLMEEFKTSREMIFEGFVSAVRSLCKFHSDVVRPPRRSNCIPTRLRTDPKYSMFGDACGAIGTLRVPFYIPTNDQYYQFSDQYLDRSGQMSQQVFAVCDFDMNFISIAPGFEGSRSRKQMFEAALVVDPDMLKAPTDRYYLVEKDYMRNELIPSLLPPIPVPDSDREERRAKRVKIVSKEQLFNARHATLHNTVNQTFTVLKSRFPILKELPETFPASDEVVIRQLDLLYALTAVHNFMNSCGHNPRDELDKAEREALYDFKTVDYEDDSDEEEEGNETDAMRDARRRIEHLQSLRKARSDKIAFDVWRQYLFESASLTFM